MPVRLIDPNNQVVEVDDNGIGAALAAGYKIETPEASTARIVKEAQEDIYGGAEGKITTFVNKAANALTLGGLETAIGLSDSGDEYARQERLAREFNPGTAAAGEITGAVLGSVLVPGSPAGILARGTTAVAEGGRLLGGIRGAARVIAATGAEAAIQNAGQYISQAALGNHELTAEGLAGALGTGFAFGGLGGGAALGIEKGTIAARRLFSKMMEGSDDAVRAAGMALDTRASKLLAADDATLKAAKEELENIRLAKQDAQLARAQQGALVQEERMMAERIAKETGFEPPVTSAVSKQADEVLEQTMPAKMPLDKITPEVLEREAKLQDVVAKVEASRTPLEEQLAAMQNKIDQGMSLKEINANKELFLKQLDDASEAASKKAATATDEVSRNAALNEVASIEQKIARESLPDDTLGDITKNAESATAYERNSADLAELMGEKAHPFSRESATAFRKAEDDATRKLLDRTTQAIDEHEMFGPLENIGPKKLSSEERLSYAKERHQEANLAVNQLKVKELEAKKAYQSAKTDFDNRSKAYRTINLKNKPSLGGESKGSTFTNIGAGLEFADTLREAGVPGIPRMPKPSDIPVIGPLLGMWLKFKGLKNAFSRGGGRVLATGDNKIAALAAQTKDRVARAVDKMLGYGEKAAPLLRRPLGTTAVVLGERIFDDGEPEPKKNASISMLAAKRSNEIAAYVGTPGAIENDVRKELRDVSDPDVVSAVIAHRKAAFDYLQKNAPKGPPPNALGKPSWQPSPAEAVSFARRLEVVNDPVAAYEAVNGGRLSLEAAETLKAVYPQLFAMGQERLMSQIGKIQVDLPFTTQVQMSILFDIPLNNSLKPESMSILQSPYQTKSEPQSPQGTQPPAPSIAGGTNLTSIYQTREDRSASRR